MSQPPELSRCCMRGCADAATCAFSSFFYSISQYATLFNH
ncbi:MAG TPA: hypothetical protein IAC40_02410 [Candidatus Faecivivens stercorigallinarum]|nr:hypothetical protein [Candidatus Faecivivens stercorigallinarum]